MEVIYAICLSFVLVEVLEWHKRVKVVSKETGEVKTLMNIKPFNCGMCLSGWICLGLCLINSSNVLLMPVAMVAYIFMEKILYKL